MGPIFRLAVAVLTFVIGVAATVISELPLALLSSLSVLFLTPLTIGGLVLYQGAYLKKEWRPAIGKGFLALFLWFFPSIVVVFGNLIYWVGGGHAEPISQETLVLKLTVSSFTIAYALAGLGLCRWVKRYDAGKHWLLNSHRA